MCCCTETISKIIVIGTNIIFLIIGIALIIPGILMLTDIDLLSENIKPLLEQISFNGVNLGNISGNLPIVFIFFGVAILFIATLGLIGACCKIKTLLVIYAIIVIILTVAEVVILVFFFVLRSHLDSTIKNEFASQLTSKYTQDLLDKSDTVSSSFNYMFMEAECCGVNAVTSTTNDFDNSPWRSGAGSGKKIPKGCCKGVTEATYTTYSNPACTDTATSGTYWPSGCYDVIMSTFGTILNSMGYICLVAVLIQICIIVFTFLLCCSYMTSVV
ncbi:CD63 antigen-like [Ylistrum balloti]|uniref:CD63 antigen-like n=1 Tax=Ylistrum balloti TaxID=509963 RepID=UPI002905A5AA|nr:CD63 antigen-like [Ylistrum balloti]